MIKSSKLERYIKEVDFFYCLDEDNRSPVIADVTISDANLNCIGLSGKKGYTQMATPTENQFVPIII